MGRCEVNGGEQMDGNMWSEYTGRMGGENGVEANKKGKVE
jgi:hypothetical protein